MKQKLSADGQPICRNFLCRQEFVPSRRFPNSPYCPSCTIDMQLKKDKRKAEKLATCKLKSCKSKFKRENPRQEFCCKEHLWQSKKEKMVAAVERKQERRASRRRKKSKGGAYPTSGFSVKRKQLKLFEAICGVSGIGSDAHVKRFKSDLHLDHIVPARIANDANGDPHNDVNMMWLAHDIHATKLKAEEFLRRARPADFVLTLQIGGWPMERVKAAMKFYGMYSDSFPWGDESCTAASTSIASAPSAVG